MPQCQLSKQWIYLIFSVAIAYGPIVWGPMQMCGLSAVNVAAACVDSGAADSWSRLILAFMFAE